MPLGYGDKWEFYHCDELGLVFFYCDNRPRHQPPKAQVQVYCAALSRTVTLSWLGRGQNGYEAFCRLRDQGDLGIDRPYPVNLFDVPHVIDPQPSRRVTEDMFDCYCDLVAVLRHAEEIENRYG